MRVSIVEKNATLREALALMLTERKNATVDTSGDWSAETDIVLADEFEVVRAMRANRIDTPAIVLSRNAGTAALCEALMGGADDYLVKPFHSNELLARIGAVLRRTRDGLERHKKETEVLRCGDLVLEPGLWRATIDGERLSFTTSQYKILALFMRRRGVVSKETIFSHLYGGAGSAAPDGKILDIFINKIRNKLALPAGKNYIETIWGRGYRMMEPEVCAPYRYRPSTTRMPPCLSGYHP